MTNLLNKYESTLYCNVSGINKIWFQKVSSKTIFISFNYDGGEGRFEIYIERGVNDSDKPKFLIEVHSLLESIFGNNNYITVVEDIADKINNILK